MQFQFDKKVSLLKYVFLCFSPLFVSPLVMAAGSQPLVFNGQIAWISNTGPSGSDFDSSSHLAGSVLIPFAANLAMEVGISQTNKATDEGVDNTGSYKLAISGNDLFGGIRFDANTLEGAGLFARAGLLYHKSEIEFEESFFGLKPSGKLTRTEEGTGFYLGAGFKFKWSDNLTSSAGIHYLTRQDFFSESPRSFEMEEIALILGIEFSSFN